MDTFDRIQKLLSDRNIEQQEFANAIGVRKQAISEWKKGVTKSYTKYIDKIADYFNVSTDYLLGKTDIMTSPSAEQQDDFTKLVNGLSFEEKEKVKEYIEFLRHMEHKREDE